ncbi:MAG: PAS domain-containing protein, partial [Oscillospiraceae bacterium]
MTGAKRRQNFMPTGGVFCCRYDSELTLISAKSSLFRFLGYPRKEFSLLFDNKLARIVHPDDLPLLLGSVSQQLNDSNMLVNEARLVCKDQTVKWIWVSAELLHSETQGDYFRCMFHDISERVLAQQQLALSEQRYELIMQQTQDTIFEWNCETNEIYYSPNFEKKFGYRMAEKDFPQGLYESGVIHPEDLELVRAYIGRIKDAADGAPCEHRLRRADGSFLWVRIHATALRDANGNPQKV